MSDKRSKILGTIAFIVLISLLIYLIFFTTGRLKEKKIEMVHVSGNNLLDETNYLNFTKLGTSFETDEISLPFIKDRFEKHPYIKSAEVEMLGNNEVKVHLTEKKISALILIESEPYFLSEDFQILPSMPNTMYVDVPVVSNPGLGKNLRKMSYVKTENVIQAFKIISAAGMTDNNLASSLSDIDLRNGGDIILTFSEIKAPVIFGRNNAAEKMVCLQTLWDKIVDGKSLMGNSEYIDLRFANEIFIGSAETTGLL